MLVTGAGLFRFFIVSQWTIFILEARGTEGRPGGNTLRNTPRIFKLTGHLSIQMVSAVAIPLVCALLWVKINTWESNHLFKLSIPSVSLSNTHMNHADRSDCFGSLCPSGWLYRGVDVDKPTYERCAEVVDSECGCIFGWIGAP